MGCTRSSLVIVANPRGVLLSVGDLWGVIFFIPCMRTTFHKIDEQVIRLANAVLQLLKNRNYVLDVSCLQSKTKIKKKNQKETPKKGHVLYRSRISGGLFCFDALNQIVKNKSCVMNTTAGYVIIYIQNDVMMFKNVI